MISRRHTKLVREGRYVAEVDVELIEEGDGWSPYLYLDDAYKLDDVREALRRGGGAPTILNAANEIAVDAFLNGGIRFTDISDIIQSTMQAHAPQPVLSVEVALEADRWSRDKADSLVHALAR